MATKTYIDGETVIDADTMNDLDRLLYDILNDPATAADARATLEAAYLAGSDSQTFSVATATAAAHAVPLSQAGTLGGFKNKIIGGDFTLNPWQRGTSFAPPIAYNSYQADRWYTGNSTSVGTVTILKTADAPTIAQTEVFTQHCLHVDITTADTDMAIADFGVIGQKIEGFNAISFGFGQAGTRYITLSFWHKHTKVGIHCVALQNSAINRSIVAEYAQAVTDTWEKAVITFPVDTEGTWLYDTGIGLNVIFCLGSGTAYHATAGVWTAGQKYATVNQVNNFDNIANNFKLALIQLEAGSVATAFETRSYQQELAMCQRYKRRCIQQISGLNTSSGRKLISVDMTGMRTGPTVTTYDSAGNLNKVSTTDLAGTVTTNVTPTAIATNTYQSSIQVYTYIDSSTVAGLFVVFDGDAEL